MKWHLTASQGSDAVLDTGPFDIYVETYQSNAPLPRESVVLTRTRLSYGAVDKAENGFIFKGCVNTSSIMNFFQKHERTYLLSLVFILYIGGYLVVNYLSVGREGSTLEIALDSVIPFLPWFVIPYIFVYIVAFLPYFFIKDNSTFRSVALTYTITTLIAYTIFLVFPVIMNRPSSISTQGIGAMVNLIFSIDFPYNSFPSLHVMYAFLPAFMLLKDYKIAGSITLVVAILIAFSTVFIKQHYILDVVGGIVLAGMGYGLYLFLTTKK